MTHFEDICATRTWCALCLGPDGDQNRTNWAQGYLAVPDPGAPCQFGVQLTIDRRPYVGPVPPPPVEPPTQPTTDTGQGQPAPPPKYIPVELPSEQRKGIRRTACAECEFAIQKPVPDMNAQVGGVYPEGWPTELTCNVCTRCGSRATDKLVQSPQVETCQHPRRLEGYGWSE